MRPERFNQEVPLRQQNPTYAAMLENVDTNVGKVIDALEELGVTKDTIIVFTSDNGGSCMPGSPNSRPTSNYPLRASKGFNYEGGIKDSGPAISLQLPDYDGYLTRPGASTWNSRRQKDTEPRLVVSVKTGPAGDLEGWLETVHFIRARMKSNFIV